MNFQKINYETAIKTNDQSIFQEIQNCLEQDFDATLDWLMNNKIKTLDKKYFTQFQAFWNSELPILFAKDLFDSAYQQDLLMYYFNQFDIDTDNRVKYCSPPAENISVLCKISEIIPDELMAFIKTGQHLLNDNRFKSFDFFQYSPNKDLQMFYKVCEVFKKKHQNEEQEKAKYDKLVGETSIEDLLMHFSFYVEKIKWEHQYENHYAISKKIQFLPQVIDLILKRKLDKNPTVQAKYKTREAFNMALMHTLQDKIHNSKKYEKFENLFAFYHHIWMTKSNPLDTFYFDKNYRAFIREDNALELSPIDINQHHNWLKNGTKYQYMFDYYGVTTLEYLFEIEKEITYRSDTEKDRQMSKHALQKSYTELFLLEAYSVLESIETPSGKINPYWLVYYINSFAVSLKHRFTNEVEALFHKTKQHYLKCILEVIAEMRFKHKKVVSPVRVNTFEEFRDMLLNMQTDEEKRFHYKFKGNASKETITAALDFYILDLNNIKNHKDINLQTQPILKIGNLCYSIPSILGDTNIASMLLNKLLPNSKRAKERNKETEQMSLTLAELFEQRGFLSAAEIEIKKGKQPITDIDCAAYKDGVLFLIELKSTYLRSDLKEILDNENAMNKAGQQLQKVENYVKKHFDVIKSKLNMDRNIELKDVRLYPLIVSTSFEQDYEFFNGYRKISLFELNIILNNEKIFLLLTAKHYLELIKKYHPNFDVNHLTKAEYIEDTESKKVLMATLEKITPYENSFYPIGDTCSPKYIIEAIEQDKVWDFLDDEPYPKYSYLQKIISLDSNESFNEHYSIFLKATDAQYKENDTLKSMKLVEQALKLYPNSDEYLVLRGDNYARQGNILKSIMDLKRATEINPQNETAHSNLAVSYCEFGDYPNALKHINQSIKLNRSNQYALEKRAMIRGLLGLPLISIVHDLKRVRLTQIANLGKTLKLC
jgi:hypothetical protein